LTCLLETIKNREQLGGVAAATGCKSITLDFSQDYWLLQGGIFLVEGEKLM